MIAALNVCKSLMSPEISGLESQITNYPLK
jgi:hypothetical protein